jgi:regulator of PEP synthase PpsR (kinase-PPPase family)
VPIVPSLPFPEEIASQHTAFVVCLIASPDRIAEVRRNRALLIGDRDLEDYVDRSRIAAEIAYTRKICAKHGWPVIDVTRRSVEETAATIIRLVQDRENEAAASTGHDHDG